MTRLFFLIFLCFHLSAFSQATEQGSNRKVAYEQINTLKNSVLLVRLHTDEAIVAEMKKKGQNKLLKEKLKELKAQNKEAYMAFTTNYTFTSVYFFYARTSDSIRNRELKNIFIGPDLKVDTSISLPSDQSIFIIDVGDIYFEAFAGHFEGMIVMDDQFVPLKKPFPYYVRKRSGFAIVKRSDVSMVQIFQRKFEEFLEESKSPRH